MQNSNGPRYTDEVISSGSAAALSLLNYAVRCCAEQHRNGRFFIFEHPHAASSWRTQPLLDLHALDGIDHVDFDQCATGLVAPGTGLPIKKRTRFLTDIPEIIRRFSQLQCACTQRHHVCERTSVGIRLSRYCQVYTPLLCRHILECICTHIVTHEEMPCSDLRDGHNV